MRLSLGLQVYKLFFALGFLSLKASDRSEDDPAFLWNGTELARLGSGSSLQEGHFHLKSNPALMALFREFDLYTIGLINPKFRLIDLAVIDGVSSGLVGGLLYRHALETPDTPSLNRFSLGLAYALRFPYPISLGVSYDHIRRKQEGERQVDQDYHLGFAIPFSKSFVIGASWQHLGSPYPSQFRGGFALSYADYFKHFFEISFQESFESLTCGLSVAGKEHLSIQATLQYEHRMKKILWGGGFFLGGYKSRIEYSIAQRGDRLWHSLGFRARGLVNLQEEDDLD